MRCCLTHSELQELRTAIEEQIKEADIERIKRLIKIHDKVKKYEDKAWKEEME